MSLATRRHPEPHAHAAHHAHPAAGASTLHAISTKHAVLHASSFAASRASIEAARKHGGLQPVSLGHLPLNQSYVPHTNDSGMTHRKPAGFEWDHTDQTTRAWWPQGITTSSDAEASGKVDGRKWAAVTWHAGNGKRARISFADVTNPNDPATAKYRHVELMVPDTKHPGHLEPLPIHVGGVSWVGHYMYVADTHGGLRVFDMNQLSKLTKPGIAPKGTLPYVLPEIGAYKLPAHARHEAGTPVFSGLSLDRKTGQLVSQEFRGGRAGGNIVSWPIDVKTGLLRSHHGTVHASHEWASPVKSMAGVLPRGDGFDIVQMGRPHSHLWHVGMHKHGTEKDTLARGAQQFSWDAQLQQIWSLGEMPGHRAVWHFKPE